MGRRGLSAKKPRILDFRGNNGLPLSPFGRFEEDAILKLIFDYAGSKDESCAIIQGQVFRDGCVRRAAGSDCFWPAGAGRTDHYGLQDPDVRLLCWVGGSPTTKRFQR